MEKHYKILRSDVIMTEKRLEELWDQGWKLVCILPVGSTNYYHFTMRGWF